MLDSAESEYEGEAWEHAQQYGAAGYFGRQLDWLESLEAAPEDARRIVLVHDGEFTSEAGFQARYRAALRA